jgi:hypothetical protein
MVNGGRYGENWFVGDDVNIEEAFALTMRRVVEARRLAASEAFSAKGGSNKSTGVGET